MNQKPLREMTREEMVSDLTKIMDAATLPLNKHMDAVYEYIATLERKLIDLEYKVARISSQIPSTQRLRVENFTVVSNDEAKKLSKGIVDRDTEFNTPTKEAHRCQCCDSDPEC
jgi:hypothetical protein